MSTSSRVYRTPHVPANSPAGWFAIAMAATLAAVVIGGLAWSALGARWAAGIVVLLVAAAGAAVASRRGRDAVVAFLTGSVVTIAGLYAALLVMAQFYAIAVQG